MYFNLKHKNPFNCLFDNALLIHRSDLSDEEKGKQYSKLYSILKKRLVENEKYLNASPAFSSRCIHWNQRDISSVKPVNNAKNPWISFKREFESAVNANKVEVATLVSISIAWLASHKYKNDWIVT